MKTTIILMVIWCCATSHLFAQVVDPVANIIPVLWNPTENNGKLANISARGMAGSGDAALIVGFVVTEQSRYVLIRAVGPTLARFGIVDFIRSPRLTLYDSSGAVMASAVSWSKSLSQYQQRGADLLARSVGAFALDANSDDAVIHLKLPPGAYTISVSSDSSQTGAALAEVYASATYTSGN